jgi:hypothetical protein
LEHLAVSYEIMAISHKATQAQTASLEASQARAVREALLGMSGGLERLKAIDAQIAALRSRLVA